MIGDATFARARILVVDDEPANVRLLERVLFGAGYNAVKGATDPRAALALFDELEPDLVMLDLHMPHLDGFAFLDALRARTPAGAYLPILVLTADTTGEAKRRALSRGARDFLTKPLDRAEVLLRTRNLLETRFLHLALRAENRALGEQLTQAQKMEVLGQLAGGVAHDFNNILSAITSYSEELLDALDERDPRHHDVRQIHIAADRGAALTRQLLAFSRKEVVSPEVLDLAAVVRDIRPMLERLVGPAVEIVARAPTAPALVELDPVRLEQVLLNLAVNARDAMPGGGTITVETAIVDAAAGGTSTTDISDTDTSVADDAAAADGPARGPCVILTVSDTGCGMDDETRRRSCEPFFTTKEAGKGTGLGLSTVFGIVTQGGGRMVIESAPGHGTTVTITLPLARRAPSAAEVRAAPDPKPFMGDAPAHTAGRTLAPR